MKKIVATAFLIFASLILLPDIVSAQNPINWTSKDLVKPADLAKTLKENKDLPVIFCVGPGASIPHSIDIGMVKDEKNLNNFKNQLSKLPKSTNIIIYCGCCPYEHCPNVRPAIAALQNMKFTNYHMLDLPTNIKTDWIAKGYPVQ
ncbi:MAG: rhodanese-like domain-containing protein [Bacteroidota bacterium]